MGDTWLHFLNVDVGPTLYLLRHARLSLHGGVWQYLLNLADEEAGQALSAGLCSMYHSVSTVVQ